MNKKEFTIKVIIRLFTEIILKLRGIIFLPLIAKWLGTYQYGIWSQLWITLILLTPVLMIRLDAASIRYLPAKDKENINKDFYSMLFFIWLIFIPISTVTFLFKEQVAIMLFDESGAHIYIHWFMILLFVHITNMFLKTYYRVFNKIFIFSLIQLLNFICSMVLAIFFVLNGGDIIEILLAFIIIESVSFVLVLFHLIKLIGFPKTFNIKRVRPYLKYSLPLVPVAFLFWVINYSDRIVIAHFLGISDVGVYSATYNIGQFLKFYIAPISFVLFPTITKLWEEAKYDQIKFYIEKSYRYYALLAIPSLFGSFYLAPSLLKILANEDFVTDKYLILFVLLGFLFIGFYQIFLYIYHLKEKVYQLPFIFLIVSIVNIGLNIILVPVMGIVGAAFSTFISYAIQTFIIYRYSKKMFDYNLNIIYLLKIILASTIMYICLIFINVTNIYMMLVAVMIGITVFLSVAIKINIIGKKELNHFKSLLNIFDK